MANRAYDIQFKRDVYAKDGVHIKNRYLCYNEECRKQNVKVYYREVDGKGQFSSIKKSDHVLGCDFVSSFNPAYVKATVRDFDPETMLEKLTCIDNNENKLNRNRKIDNSEKTTLLAPSVNINTLYQLLQFCRSNDPSHNINEKYTVGDIFINELSAKKWETKINFGIENEIIVLVVGKITHLFRIGNYVRVVIGNKTKFDIEFISSGEFEIFRNKLNKFKENKGKIDEGVGVYIAVYARFCSQKKSFIKHEKEITYEVLSGKVYDKQVRILGL
ncbi:MAG: hypothetical protein FWG90_01725 [Oscillospiraceae bacterium]|nr:hypothetical protein [Oscillospiraceae bacterium]